jgi:hypothetical protein
MRIYSIVVFQICIFNSERSSAKLNLHSKNWLVKYPSSISAIKPTLLLWLFSHCPTCKTNARLPTTLKNVIHIPKHQAKWRGRNNCKTVRIFVYNHMKVIELKNTSKNTHKLSLKNVTKCILVICQIHHDRNIPNMLVFSLFGISRNIPISMEFLGCWRNHYNKRHLVFYTTLLCGYLEGVKC